jgi:hypothetical protein
MSAKEKTSLESIATPYAGTAGRSRTSISDDMAKQLLALWKKNRNFTIPVHDFNELIGIGDDTARAWQIKRLLNKQHFDKLDEGYEWAVGQTAGNTQYVFHVRKAKVEE